MHTAWLLYFADKNKIYRQYKVKRILIQPPAVDTAFERILKKYFYLKKGSIVVSLTGIWKICMPVLCENFAGD